MLAGTGSRAVLTALVVLTLGSWPERPACAARDRAPLPAFTLPPAGTVLDAATHVFDVEVRDSTCCLPTGAATGDLNGDGRADLVLGGTAAEHGSRPAVRVLFGPHVPPTARDLAASAADVTVVGPSGVTFGTVLAVGDVSGDSLDDLVVGDRGGLRGQVHVFFGPLAPGVRNAVLAPADVVITGRTATSFATNFGASIAVADLTADGFPDLAVGAPGSDGLAGDRPGAGETDVFFGPLSAGTRIDLAVSQPDVLVLGRNRPPLGPPTPSSGDRLGEELTTGDVDADGLTDLVVGAPSANDHALGCGRCGMIHVLLAPLARGRVLDVTTHVADVRLRGRPGSYALGGTMRVGDVSGDGHDDVASQVHVSASLGRSNSGGVQVQFGPLRRGDDLALDEATADVLITGAAPFDFVGHSLALGDVTGDGIDDLATSSVLASGPSGLRRDAGVVYLVAGPLRQGTFVDLRADAIRLTVVGQPDARLGTVVLTTDVTGDDGLDLVMASRSALSTTTDALRVVTGNVPVTQCRRRGKGWWHRQCLSVAGPEGIARGNDDHPAEHPALGEAEFRGLVSAVDPIIAGAAAGEGGTCDALDARPAGDPCQHALADLAAYSLDLASASLGQATRLRLPDGRVVTPAEAQRALVDLVAAGACRDASQLAARLNHASCVR